MEIETGIDDRQVDVVADYLKDKKITIGVTGGIAAIEMPKLARQLRRYGAKVRAIMTPMAEKIINPIAMHWGTGSEVVTELGGKAEHIELEDLVVVAPVTLNTINKIANGIADNSLTTAVASAMGRGIPVLMAPAMHASLYNNPILNENIEALKGYGVKFIEPRGGEGKAKVARNEDIAAMIARELASGPLKGKNILINAGPTRGPIDAVRYIANRSSGSLGIAIANDLYLRGANVKLVYGPGTVAPPHYLDVANVETPQQMLEAMVKELTEKNYDAAIFTAAVLDYAPETMADTKLKSGKELAVKFVSTPKIIKEVDKVGKKLFKVGFKLEYKKTREEMVDIAYTALIENHASLVVANDLSEIKGRKHPAYVITPEKGVIEVASKDKIVSTLADVLGRRLNVTYFKTVFDDKKVSSQHYAAMKAAGEMLAELDVIPKVGDGTFGNYSVRLQEGFSITARKADKSNLNEEDVVYVRNIDFEKKEKHVSGIKKPSSETLAHKLIYDAFPEAKAIIHVHDNLVLKHADKLDVPVTEFDFQCGTLESAKQALGAATKSDYIILKNHGSLVKADNLPAALKKIAEYHTLAKSFEQGIAPKAEQRDFVLDNARAAVQQTKPADEQETEDGCYYMKYIRGAEK